MPHQATITSAGQTSVEKLAQFFPDALAVRIPVRVRNLGSHRSATAGKDLEESTVIEFGTAREVLFASQLPLEFDDHLRLENAEGSLVIDATVVAVQYHDGRTAVAARFTRPISNWIIQR